MDSNITTTVVAISLLTAQNLTSVLPIEQEQVLAMKEISLENRYSVPSVNQVFKDNILLNTAYLRQIVSDPKKIDWTEVQKPFKYEFKLQPGEVFAFHDDELPEYEGKVVKTTNAHFNAAEGFKFSGLLYGDGVCHLASLIYWAALDAGLEANAPTNHDFRVIPEIPREYGVSIYNMPGNKSANARQNLYVKNNQEKPIAFKFEYEGNELKVAITK